MFEQSGCKHIEILVFKVNVILIVNVILFLFSAKYC